MHAIPNIFRFKRFNVVNERSAMKVNTDGVLLGALMTILPTDRRLLDIGTGTGTIALMAAQRLMGLIDSDDTISHFVRQEIGSRNTIHSVDQRSPHFLPDEMTPSYKDIRHEVKRIIDAIDIDEPSASEAASNFRNSPWSDVLHVHHTSLEDFAAGIMTSNAGPKTSSSDDSKGYDLIFSNPPYFDNALQAPHERRNAARHTSTGLSYREILDFASIHLDVRGRVVLVLPSDTERDLTRYARMCGLHLHKITRIRTVPRKAPSRIIAEFSHKRVTVPEENLLTIQDGGQYTQEYLDLMREFYLFA